MQFDLGIEAIFSTQLNAGHTEITANALIRFIVLDQCNPQGTIETALQQADIFHLRAVHRGDAIIGFGRNADLLSDLLDYPRGIARRFLTAIDAVNHHRHGVGGALHTDFQLIDDGGYY